MFNLDLNMFPLTLLYKYTTIIVIMIIVLVDFLLPKNMFYCRHVFNILNMIENLRRLNITHPEFHPRSSPGLFKTPNNLPTRLLAKGTFS